MWPASPDADVSADPRHEPAECRYAHAAWLGFERPRRHQRADSSCMHGGHRLWWKVDAPDAASALVLLPSYVAARSAAEPIRALPIP